MRIVHLNHVQFVRLKTEVDPELIPIGNTLKFGRKVLNIKRTIWRVQASVQYALPSVWTRTRHAQQSYEDEDHDGERGNDFAEQWNRNVVHLQRRISQYQQQQNLIFVYPKLEWDYIF